MKYPKSIENLIKLFSTLPSVGPKTAERYVFYLLKKSPEELRDFGKALALLKSEISICKNCLALVEKNSCPVCSDPRRDSSLLCVVADNRDMAAIDSTRNYNGYYHILNGELNAIEGIRPEDLHIKALIEKLRGKKIKEVILGLNPNLDGETTAMYLTKLIKSAFPGIKVTRLARGLPMGADIEYADELTLSNSLKYRSEM
ncbi:MAG: recombination mediator RecR [Patescibacteria group bacterium]|jgi:recombination protein RecR